jgi:peptide/nickel transport system substrate-binding protein
MMNRRSFLSTTGGLILAAATSRRGFAEEPKILRVVPQSDLKILDPIWTTAIITRNHGYAIYDTLFGVDADGHVQPQMISNYSQSDDGKTWTFRLRKGLKFHDGAPVTSADVIQSLKRWGQRDNLGQKLVAAGATLEARSDDTFVMTLKKSFGLVVEALSKPASVPPFIMPKRVAETPADRQITSTIGSGPFIFKADEYRPGERVVYVKNTEYVPRDEPASGTAGGKVVNVDRMEWVVLTDGQTQTNAIINGEVDLIEWVPADQYTALKSSPKISFANLVPKGSFALHLNHLFPPFNNVKMAQAAIMAISQDALMKAQMVHSELYNTNPSLYPTGTVYHSDKTSYFTGKPQFARARELLKEAGYNNEPVVLLYPSSFAILNKFPPVMAALLKQAGFNVDLQSMDWPTLVARRALKVPPAQGGWGAFITGWNVPDNINPLFYAPVTGNGQNGWFGWPTDERVEALKDEFLAATTEDQRKSLADEIQERVFDAAIVAPIGEYKQISAVRKDVIRGAVTSPVCVFWGIQKG